MSSLLVQLMIFALAAAIANLLGGLILFPARLHKIYRRFTKYLLALGAGFMLAVTFFEILPKTVLLWQNNGPISDESLYFPMLLLLAGYLLTQFFEHTLAPHFHLGEEVHSSETIPTSSAYSAVGGLLIHTFFDGVSIAAASQLDLKVGFLVFLAVLLHKFPEGFMIGSLVMAAGKGFKEVIFATSLVGFMTILGVFVFYLIGSNMGSSVAYAMPIAGGVTLYVAASDLIPEVNHHGGRSPLVSLSVFGGVALFYVTQLMLHQLLEH